MVGAGAGDEDSAGGEEFEGSEVEFFIAAEGTFCGSFGFGEGGWVEDDGFETRGVGAGLGFVVAEEVEGVGFDPVCVVAGGESGVEEEVGVGDFESSAAGVYAGDAGAGLGEMKGEAALVGADVEGSAVGVAGGGGVVEALVEECAGLLAGGGVVGEMQAVDGEGGLGFLGGVGGGFRVWDGVPSSRMRGSGRSRLGWRRG